MRSSSVVLACRSPLARNEDRGEHKGYHFGSHHFCALEVQAERRFQLPRTLPWLPQFDTTSDALAAAFEAADPDAAERASRAGLLAAERKAARGKRLAALD